MDFNKAILKTNFFKPRKSTLAYRLNADFVADSNLFDTVPYGVFLVLSNDFQAFHVRFRNVARGGIRLIPSRDEVAYQNNLDGQFAENYNLADTQNLKNKDIPEFGSKGTILLDRHAQTHGIAAFRKYISGLLDVIIPSKHIVDHLEDEELLFLTLTLTLTLIGGRRAPFPRP